MRVFILDSSFCGEEIYQLRKREKQYLLKVLRLQEGEVFTAQDKEGNYYKATIVDEETLSIEPTDKPEDTLLDGFSAFKGTMIPITVYQCICKGKKNEQILRMLTEAGIEEFFLVSSDFTQEKTLSKHDAERLETIAKEAMQQSGSRTKIKEYKLQPLKEALKTNDKPLIFLHQSLRGNTLMLKDTLEKIDSSKGIALLIGSEGGFSDEECAYLEEKGAFCTLLPTNILRAETAGIFAVGAIETILNI